jgi:putative ABC transport system permease protein
VKTTVWFSSRQLPFENTRIRLVITELDKALRFSRILFKSPQQPPDLSRSDATDSVLVSESFAVRFHKAVGESIQLPVAHGAGTFTIRGIYYDYASNQGTVMLDRHSYERHYATADKALAPQHLSVYLQPGADVETVRRRLLDKLGPDEKLYCVTNSEVRSEALRIFDSTFTITYALQFVAIVVAGLGVASTLITLIYQRQREIGLLSLVGATPWQLRRVVLAEAVIIGGVSQVLGVIVGIVLAVVLIFVINVQSFGWTIQIHLPFGFLLQSTLLILVGSAAFGLYPAVHAANVRALETVREE